MSTKRNSVSTRRRHEFLGEEDGKKIVAWLRTPKGRSKRDPINRIVTLERRARLLMEDVRSEIFETIAQTVRAWRYRLLPVGFPEPGQLAWKSDWRPVVNRGISRQQLDAFNALIRLGGQGLVSRVRACARCGEPFYAKLQSQTYDTDGCRKLAKAADPERKKKRAEYMRQHRATVKKLHSKKTRGGK